MKGLSRMAAGSDPQRDPHTGLVIPFEGLALAA